MSNQKGFSLVKAEAAGVISAVQMRRLVVIALLNTNEAEYDVDRAAAEAGNTKASFQKLQSNLFKDLRDNNCFADPADDLDAIRAASGVAVTPKKTPGGRKRKGDGSEEIVEGTPSKKKPSTKTNTPNKRVKKAVEEQPDDDVKAILEADDYSDCN